MQDEIFRRMMKGEYFPVTRRFGSNVALSPQIPPLHEDIITNGIDIDSALSLFGNALENTVSDIEDAVEHVTDIFAGTSQLKERLEDIQRDPAGKISYEKPLKKGIDYVYTHNAPPIGEVAIYKDRIDFFGDAEKFRIVGSSGRKSYYVPMEITLPSELMEEYGFELEKILKDYKEINCTRSCGWEYHNLVHYHKIFLKNLIIKLNNDIVRKKYSE